MSPKSFVFLTSLISVRQHLTKSLVRCALEDEQAVHDLVRGCDGIVHLGGVSVERAFDPIESANLRGVYNLYEAARLNGLPRILFASSNHTIGYYPQGKQLAPDTPFLPDGLYGVSKIFGEAMASLYHSKFGQETAIVRIGSCEEKALQLADAVDLAELRRLRFADRGHLLRAEAWMPGHLGRFRQ